MSEIDLVREVSRLLGPVTLIFVGLYGWKKRKWAKLVRNLLLALSIIFIGADSAGFEVVVKTPIPDRVFDAAVWLLLAAGLWFIANAVFEKTWGERET